MITHTSHVSPERQELANGSTVSQPRACPPCLGNCNQGRTCPAHQKREQRTLHFSGVTLAVAVVVVALCAWAACYLPVGVP